MKQDFSREDILLFLRKCVIERIGVPDKDLDNGSNLADLGIHSIDAVLIFGKVEDYLRIEIDPVVMFEYRTIQAIADHLVTMKA